MPFFFLQFGKAFSFRFLFFLDWRSQTGRRDEVWSAELGCHVSFYRGKAFSFLFLFSLFTGSLELDQETGCGR